MTADADPIPLVTGDDEAAGSGDVVADNVAALKALFPAIVTDGRVDFDVLRQLLGDEVEEADERYGLNWHGKRAARAFALTPSVGTLRPARDDSVDWDTTGNLMIEGDNLEVLKLLRRSYAKQVKLIYIDPPYNTGNDFVYPDDYRDSLGAYERMTGQRGEEAEALSSNPESSGRFHTDWLNMMYPRLMLAKELLRDDGTLIVSIDEGESPRLRSLLDELFGEENHVGDVVWEKVYTTKNDARNLSNSHEYLLIYSQSSTHFSLGTLPRTSEMDARYTNPDGDERGKWKAIPYYARGERKNGRYPIVSPTTGREHWPEADSHWRSNSDETERLIADNRIYFGLDGNAQPSFKRFLVDLSEGIKAKSLWRHSEVGSNDSANAEIKHLFKTATSPVSFPKPALLLSRVVALCSAQDDIVLDFFAGSGTTGHAVMAQNAADGGSRRHILVQLPEPLDPANKAQKTAADFCDTLGKPRTIAELTKERLRRAGAKLADENPPEDGKSDLDTGFRVYKLATSNLKPWNPHPDDLEGALLDAVDNVLPGRTEDDLLTELLLKTGADLSSPVTTRSLAGADVHALGGGTLIVCLSDVGGEVAADAEALGHAIADWRAELDPPRATTFWFRDTGFASAAAKANMAAVLKQRLGDGIAKLSSF